MCGIAGILLQDGKVNESELIAIRDSLSHRGPDDAGIWINDRAYLALVHRRLSIIDLSNAAHQPMENEDGTIQLVFNGEIYNFKDLRKELIQKGHRFKSNSDSEVVVHAYEEWGEASVLRFNGMFSFAIHDGVNNQMFLARDRFGEKPLYYFHDDRVFAFSSELKAFRFCSHTPLSMVFNQVIEYIIFGYSPYPKTFFEHTYKLPPAHVMIVDIASNDVRVERYWHELDVHGQTFSNDRTDDILSELDQMLIEAVDLRLVSDVPVGAFLSGGIDSSLIVSLMCNLKKRVKTFSIGFWEHEFDEAPQARAIANYLGCDHNELYVQPEEALDVLVNLPQMYDEPFADSSAVPTFLVSRFAREQVKVVLTGDGGDELFGGYTTYPYMALAPLLSVVPNNLRTLLADVFSHVGWGSIKRHADVLRLNDWWEVFLYLNERTIAKTADAKRLLKEYDFNIIRNSGFVSAYTCEPRLGAVNSAMYADAKTYLVDDILTKVDRATMAVSLEARIPFLDHRIAEFATRRSERQKLGILRWNKKRLLKQLLSRYLPRELFGGKKRGFNLPLKIWFRKELIGLLDNYLEPGRLKREGLFDIDFVAQIKREHLSGTRDREAVLWALVFWQMWREEWRV